MHSASKVLGGFLHFCYFRFQLLISSLVEKSWAEQHSCREFVLLLFGSGNYWRLWFTKWKKPQNFRGRVQTEDQTDKKNIKRFEISMIFWIRPPMSCYIGAYPYYSTVLAVFDLSFNFICGLDASLKAFDFDKNVVHSEWACQGTGPNPAWVGLYPYVFWPFSNIFMTASMYMTVAISIDRYIVVCYPFYACERESVMNNPQNCPVDWKRVVKYRVVQK